MSNRSREYYLKLLGLTGEILSVKASTHAPTMQSTAGDELRRMMADDLIRYHRHIDGKRTFRICDPSGFEEIRGIDERFYEHAELLVGKKNARYTGSREYRLKKRKEAVLIKTLADAGFIADGVAITKGRSIYALSPTLINAEEIIRSVPSDSDLFLSGGLLRKRPDIVTHARRELSISAGTLFTHGGVYSTFVINSSKFRWSAAAETAAASDTLRMFEDARNIDRRKDGRFRAILFTDTEKIASEIMRMTLKGNHRMDPTNIFRLSYLVPFSNPDHAMDITRMLAIPDWRKKTDHILGYAPDKRYDGWTDDEKPVHNLLCCNIARIKEAERAIRLGKCRVIIHDWQKPMIENLFETEVEALQLTDKHFKGLLLAVKDLQGENF